MARDRAARFAGPGDLAAAPWSGSPSSGSSAAARPRSRRSPRNGRARSAVRRPRFAGGLVERLCALPGIGPWTAHYIAMRGLGWPDAFPPGDVAALKAMRRLFASDVAERCQAHAERWRPWRAYALLRLWNSLSRSDSMTDATDAIVHAAPRNAASPRRSERCCSRAPGPGSRARGSKCRSTIRTPIDAPERDDDRCSQSRAPAARVLRRDGDGFDVPLDLQGTQFQRAVWQELLRSRGRDVSYGEIARGARRSVGEPRRRCRRRPQPGVDHRSVPSRRRQHGRTDRLRRRPRPQDLAPAHRGRARRRPARRAPAGAPLRPRDLVELVVLAAIWGASFLFMRIAAPAFGPVALVFIRVAGAALLLVPLLAARGGCSRDRPALARDRDRRRSEFGAAVSLFRIRGPVDHRRAVGDLQLGDATVRRRSIAWRWLADRMTPAAQRGSGDRLCRRSLARLGQGRLPAGRIGVGDRRVPRRDDVATESRRASRSATWVASRRSRSRPAASSPRRWCSPCRRS